MVKNVHDRTLFIDIEKAGRLIDDLSSTQDKLWPKEDWPAMKFNRSLEVGARGGHGPIHYEVVTYKPGRFIQFKFLKPYGFIGTHEFRIEELSPSSVKISHQIDMELRGFSRVSWPLIIRWLHDSLIEEALDKATSYADGKTSYKRKRSLYIKMLRKLGNNL